MPTLPKWIANGAEKLFSSQYYHVEVSETEYLDKDLKRVRFAGDLGEVLFQPGRVAVFRVNDTDFRHYTPAFYDQKQGVCDIIFYLHGHGPGSRWASALKKGDTTKLMGPGGNMCFRHDSQYHFFFGDESSLGLYQHLKSCVHSNDQDYLCLLELDQKHLHWPNLVGIHTDVVGKSDKTPGAEAVLSLQEMGGRLWEVWKEATFYLSGRDQSIQSFRKALVDKGVGTKQILVHSYWSAGKRGL